MSQISKGKVLDAAELFYDSDRVTRGPRVQKFSREIC